MSTSQRAWSIKMRDSAMRSSVTPCSAIGLPNATRASARATHKLERALGQTDQPHAVMDAPGTEAPLRDLEAAALAEQDVLRRHAHVLEVDLAVAVRRVVVAEHRQLA